MSFSVSLIRRELRCGPAMTRSMASSRASVADQLLVLAGGQQRRLVQHVGQVGTGEPRGTARDRQQVDVRGHRLPAGWTFRIMWRPAGSGASTPIWRSKRPGAAARVQHVGTVGGRDQDDAAAHVEAVHLDEQLVERLLALVVATAHAGAAVAADGVDLVDEDDRGGVLLGLLEQVADPGGTDADEHLDEVEPEIE